MGLLKFLFQLPFYILKILFEACGYFLVFLFYMLKAILWLFSPIIGDINWSTPKWYPKAHYIYGIVSGLLTKQKTVLGSAIMIAMVAYFSGNYAYHWYLNRPKPIVQAPIVVNSYDAIFYAPNYSSSALQISFTGNKRSPAPLELIGKTITEGITISPAIEGHWYWYDHKNIKFEPELSWPLGVSYTIKLQADKLFSEHNLLSENAQTSQFTTQDFSYSIENEEFYQNPTDPDNKLAIFTVQFSHPVDKTSLEKNISLALYELATDKKEKFIQNYQTNVTYDDKNNTAYIKSSPLSFPDHDSQLRLSIQQGIKSTLGGTPTSSLKSSYVSIPSKFNLQMTQSDVSLLEINDKEIRQILTVSFNHNVKPNDINNAITVWALPALADGKHYIKRYYDELDHTYKNRIEVSKEDLAKSSKLSLKLIETDNTYQNNISFEFSTDQQKDIYILLNKPIKSEGGYYLTNDFHDVAVVPRFPEIVKFVSDGSVLSLSGDKKLPIVSRNIAQIKLDIERVIPSQLQHLVNFNNNNFNWMDFGDLSSDSFVEKYSVTKTIKGSPQEIKYTDINLSEFLQKDIAGNEIRGVFLVKLYANSVGSKPDQFTYYNSRFVMVTDLGIITKKSLDQSHDVFVQSIHTGEPINNAKVSVLGVNGIEIITEQTDATGHVKFEPFANYYQGIKPLLFVIEKDHDLSFLPIRHGYDRQLNFSRFDVGGIYETLDGGELRTHLFSDRGIYRPGDSFNIGMIIRAQNWSKSLEGVRLEYDIYDPKYIKADSGTLVLDEYGFEEITYKTQYASPTGEWFINVYLKDPRNDYRSLLGTTSVVIREFEPDKTAVSLTLYPEIKQGWVDPVQLYAKVEAKNLFGTPAQDRKVKSQLILEPASPNFTKYSDYAFYQNITNYRNSFNIPVEDSNTDEEGIATLSLPVQSFEGSYSAKVLTEVFEPDSGRSVAATASVFVSSADFLVGGKADGSLNYIKRDSSRTLKLIAIDSKLEQIELTNLTLITTEQKYISSLVKQPSGVYKYKSNRKDIVISESPLTINKEGTIQIIDSQTPGNYALQVKDKNGNIVYQTSYSIAGTANVSRNLERNAELALKIDSNQYKAGDEIEVSITAPYMGSGIITIERDQVYAWKWFKTNTTSSVQKIKIPDNISGNAYINVQFLRDPSSDEIFMSPLSYGVVPFKISNEKFDDHITLTTPDLIKPGDILPITIKTNSPQRVVIFAVDEGILQVSGYKLNNPLSEFLRKRALSVRTAQILDLILPEYSQLITTSAPGGDDEERSEQALAANLNPFKRKVDEPVTYWSGIISVDGQSTVEYKVPDYFNGKIRIMAVSVGKNTMGHTQTKTTVRNDFVLNPNIPYFVAPGDEFEISLAVANNIENLDVDVAPIKITLNTSEQLTILDEATKVIELSSMKEGVVHFKLKATDKLGSGDFHFTASYGQSTAERQISTSVRPATNYRLETIMGRMDGSNQTINDIRQMYQPFSERDARISFSPFVLSKGLSLYLENYPHYCSEQILSRAIPLLIANKHPEFNLVNDKTIALSSLYQTLRNRQNSDGAIGLWYSTYSVDPFITLYTVHFMLEAQDAGQILPSTLLKQANRYVKTVAASGRTDVYGLRLRAYAIYLLTRQNEVTTSYIASLMDDLNSIKNKSWQTDLTALHLAASYKMLKMDREANKLFKPVWNELSKAYNAAWWSHNYYDPLVIDASKIYLISKHFSNKTAEIPAQALENLVIMLNKQKYTTQSSAITMLALDSYSSSIEQSKLSVDDLTISAKSSDDKQVIIAKLNGLLSQANFTADTVSLYFDNNTDYPAWYAVAQQGYDHRPQLKPITKGLEIYRELTNDKDEIIEKVKQGDTVNVTIKIRTLSKEGATNIAIVDLLPGGFEVVQKPLSSINRIDNNHSLDSDEEYEDEDYDREDDHDRWVSPIAVGDHTWYPDYTDVREDRVIIYGSTENDEIQTFKYQIKATNVGEYIVPSAFGEAMYDRDIQAISKGGSKISIEAE